jgi:hypothetical protein
MAPAREIRKIKIKKLRALSESRALNFYFSSYA